MKHTPIVLAILFLFIIIVAYFYTKNEVKTPHVVRSDDSTAELHIPHDAVLSGGTLADITMTAIPNTEFFAESSQPTENAKVYKLEPNGLTFSKPATIVVTYPYDATKSYAPIFLTQADDGSSVVSLDITDAQVDEAEKTMTISGELSHFTIFVSNPEPHMFVATTEPVGKLTKSIGESFVHTLLITPGKWEYVNHPSRLDPNYTVRVTLEIGNGTRWNMNNHYRSPHIIRTSGNMVPAEVVREPANLAVTEAYRLATTYTCQKEGEDSPSVMGGAWFTYTLQLTTVDSVSNKPRVERDPRLGWVLAPTNPHVNCVARVEEGVTTGVTGSANVNTSTPAPTTPKKPTGVIMVCGLPGGPACTKR